MKPNRTGKASLAEHSAEGFALRKTRFTDFQSKYWAALLSLRGPSGSLGQLARSISNARVDLNPHQVDAALFAVRSPLAKGVVLADEVGLGKTIEAGLVLAQRWAERRRRILIIVPATLRKQWAQELDDKFHIPTIVLESASFNRMVKSGHTNPFDQEDRVVVLTVKKIPQAVLSRCEWGRDDYSLNVDSLPPVQAVEEQRAEAEPEADDDENRKGKASGNKAKAPAALQAKKRGRRRKASAMQELPLFAGLDNGGEPE